MFKYSVIETPLNKWAVIKPLEITRPNYGDIKMPTWLPNGFTHLGIFNTLDEACARMESLRQAEGVK